MQPEEVGHTLDVGVFLRPDPDSWAGAVALEGRAGDVPAALAGQGPVERLEGGEADEGILSRGRNAVVADTNVQVVQPQPAQTDGGHACAHTCAQAELNQHAWAIVATRGQCMDHWQDELLCYDSKRVVLRNECAGVQV